VAEDHPFHRFDHIFSSDLTLEVISLRYFEDFFLCSTFCCSSSGPSKVIHPILANFQATFFFSLSEMTKGWLSNGYGNRAGAGKGVLCSNDREAKVKWSSIQCQEGCLIIRWQRRKLCHARSRPEEKIMCVLLHSSSDEKVPCCFLRSWLFCHHLPIEKEKESKQ